MHNYSQELYQEINDCKESAKEIWSIVQQYIKPSSVVDIGCGLGTWLSVIRNNGINDILGIDGDYIDRNLLLIPSNKFMPTDLREKINLSRKFDLCMSLEVAEHLDKEYADLFVKNLVDLSDVILFSAAIPEQTGTCHYNEQWPEYWINIFSKYNYLPVDCLRQRIWNNPNVTWWYKQNIFIFINKDKMDLYPDLAKEHFANTDMFSLVHPELFKLKNAYLKASNKKLSNLKKPLFKKILSKVINKP